MRYCLSIGLHNLFFDIAVVDNHHKIINSYKCNYDRSKDISNNIYLAYKKYFSDYNIEYVGVGVSSNIKFKDDILYSVTSFNFHRYNLKQSLYKLFKVQIYISEDTNLAALTEGNSENASSLLYIVLDNRIGNSFVVKNELIVLEDDINLSLDEKLNNMCSKIALKAKLLSNGYDDEYIGGYFICADEKIQTIISEWAKQLNKHVEKIVKELPVDRIVFAGYLGEYFEYFKESMDISKKVNCSCVKSHRSQTLIGVSHLIFKDKCSKLENKFQYQ